MPGPDFSKLNFKVEEAKRPAPLPAGDYPGIIESHRIDATPNTGTAFVEFTIPLTGWADSVMDDSKVDSRGGEINLAKRRQRVSFYITEDAYWRFALFAKQCGVTSGEWREVAQALHGSPVSVEITQYLDAKDGVVKNKPNPKVVGMVDPGAEVE